MISWFRSKCTHDTEYAQLRKRVTDLELRADDLEAFQENIRNMARKVQKRRESQETEAEDAKDLNPRVILPE